MFALAFLGVWEGSYRHSEKQDKRFAALSVKFREIEDAKPCITLRNPYTQKVFVAPNTTASSSVISVDSSPGASASDYLTTAAVVFHAPAANVLRVTLENTAQNHYPNNEAKGVIARISFYDSSGRLLISDMDGRWTGSTQPVGPHTQSILPLLGMDFPIGAKRDLDIAFTDVTYPETHTGFVALNNDNFRFSGWKKREHILAGDRFVAKIRISAVWVDSTFSVEFWAMPHGEIGYRVT
jgi:hypothetical protein